MSRRLRGSSPAPVRALALALIASICLVPSGAAASDCPRPPNLPGALPSDIQALLESLNKVFDRLETARESPQRGIERFGSYTREYPSAWAVQRAYIAKVSGITAGGFNILVGIILTGAIYTPAGLYGAAVTAVGAYFGILNEDTGLAGDYHAALVKDLTKEHGFSEADAHDRADAVLAAMAELEKRMALTGSGDPITMLRNIAKWVSADCGAYRKRGKPDGGRIDHKTFGPLCLLRDFFQAPGGKKGGGKKSGSLTALTGGSSGDECVEEGCPAGMVFDKDCCCCAFSHEIDVVDNPINPFECKVWVIWR